MTSERVGCILVLVVSAVAIAISWGLFWCASFVRPGLIAWGAGTWLSLALVSLVVFWLLLEFGHRLRIHLFFRRRGVKIERIRAFKNHYRVYYFRDGKKLSG